MKTKLIFKNRLNVCLPEYRIQRFFLYFTFNRDFISKGFCCHLFLARHVIDEVHGRHFPDAMVQHTFCPNTRIAQYIYRISPQEVAVVHPYSLSERSTGGHYPLCCYHGNCNRPQPQRWVMIAYTFRLHCEYRVNLKCNTNTIAGRITPTGNGAFWVAKSGLCPRSSWRRF